MPFKGFNCVHDGEPVFPDDCIKCSRKQATSGEFKCNFTPQIIRGIAEGRQDRDLMAYSVTEVIGCHRRTVLKERYPYRVPLSQSYWAFRGQLTHLLVERFSNGHGVAEKRLYAHLGGTGQMLTGKPDIYYPDTRVLVDFKTTGKTPRTVKKYTCEECSAVIRANERRAGKDLACPDCGATYGKSDLEPTILPPRPKSSHVPQLNAYRWLLAQEGVEIGQLYISYMSMAKPRRVPVEMWSLEEAKTYLKAKMMGLMAREGPNELPEGVWDDADRNWRCRYCEVLEQCESARAGETLERGRKLLRGDPEDQDLL